MGAAHLENWTGSITPAFYNRASSCSTLCRRANGTVRGLQNLGWPSGSIIIVAVTITPECFAPPPRLLCQFEGFGESEVRFCQQSPLDTLSPRHHTPADSGAYR